MLTPNKKILIVPIQNEIQTFKKSDKHQIKTQLKSEIKLKIHSSEPMPFGYEYNKPSTASPEKLDERYRSNLKSRNATFSPNNISNNLGGISSINYSIIKNRKNSICKIKNDPRVFTANISDSHKKIENQYLPPLKSKFIVKSDQDDNINEAYKNNSTGPKLQQKRLKSLGNFINNVAAFNFFDTNIGMKTINIVSPKKELQQEKFVSQFDTNSMIANFNKQNPVFKNLTHTIKLSPNKKLQVDNTLPEDDFDPVNGYEKTVDPRPMTNNIKKNIRSNEQTYIQNSYLEQREKGWYNS